mmetsp:Transcript_83140/g.217116  ORF Transcript_83140/g.217116 Transcript_83140/m.217116 type:complete len:207 (+) Transcript_83140:111-731(+)
MCRVGHPGPKVPPGGRHRNAGAGGSHLLRGNWAPRATARRRQPYFFSDIMPDCRSIASVNSEKKFFFMWCFLSGSLSLWFTKDMWAWLVLSSSRRGSENMVETWSIFCLRLMSGTKSAFVSAVFACSALWHAFTSFWIPGSSTTELALRSRLSRLLSMDWRPPGSCFFLRRLPSDPRRPSWWETSTVYVVAKRLASSLALDPSPGR